MRQLVMIFVMLCFLFACQSEDEFASATKTEHTATNKTAVKSEKVVKVKVIEKSNVKKVVANMITVQGTIHYFDLEGGFYGIITKNGQKLLPLNLAKEYQQAGAVIEVEGELVQDMMTIQQWGTPFKIYHLELISAAIVHNRLQ